jgi:hypothetical protein
LFFTEEEVKVSPKAKAQAQIFCFLPLIFLPEYSHLNEGTALLMPSGFHLHLELPSV